MNMFQNKNNFNWGIVGTGHIAKKFVSDLFFLNNHKVIAVSSRSKKNAETFAKNFNIDNFFDNHKDILLINNIDAVYIATDTSLHTDLSVYFLNKGIPVLCEKPFALSFSDSQKIISASINNNVAFMEAMWTLYLPLIKDILKDISNKKIGNIISFDATYGRYFKKDNKFRLFNKDLGGGSLYDLGIYPIAILSCIVNNINIIKSYGFINEFGVDDCLSSILSFDGGRATISCSIINSLSNTATISGEYGKIVIESPLYNSPKYTIYDNNNNIIGGKEIKYNGFGLREQAEYFKNMIINKKIESEIYGFDKMTTTMRIMQLISDEIGLCYE